MKLLELIRNLKPCEYAPLCKAYQKECYDCQHEGRHCITHKHRKQLEESWSYA
ncbi:MAG: hypothetical protein WC325_11360 [Candidatus Bathyarchaeia archaeon]